MAMDAVEIERLIKAHIPDAEVTIRDLAGDGDHYAATVISAIVQGQVAGAAASAGLRGPQGADGRRAACARIADRHAVTGRDRGVRVLSPKGAIEPTGTWSLGARAGDFVFVAGMRGIDPANNKLSRATKRASARHS